MRAAERTCSDPAGPSHSHVVAGIAVLVLFAAAKLIRASVETSISVDDIFSLTLAAHPVGEIVDITAADVHPPGYYILLKYWTEWGSCLSALRPILWARLPGLLGWSAAVIAAWYGARMLGARCAAPAVAIATAAGGMMAGAANSVRSYGIMSACVLICFLFLVQTALGSQSRRARVIAGTGYAVCATILLWGHLLGTVALGLLGLLWLALIAVSRCRREMTVSIGAAQLVAVLFFLPWISAIRTQVNYDPGIWRTPPTFTNLFLTFSFWLPFGDVPLPRGAALVLCTIGGTAGWTLPLGGTLLALRRNRCDSNNLLLMYGTAAVVIAAADVLLLWGADRLGLGHTWHGPRYPVLVAGLWAFGLALLAAFASRIFQKPALVPVLLLPWIACGAAGQVWGMAAESHTGLKNWDMNLSPGTRLYVLPSLLVPYHREALARYDIRPVQELLSLPADRDEAYVLNLNPWPVNETLAEVYARGLVLSPRLFRHRSSQTYPDAYLGYTLLHLEGYNRQLAERLRKLPFRPLAHRHPSTAMAYAIAENQRRGDGWSPLMIREDLEAARYPEKGTVTVRFAGSAGPGPCTLFLAGKSESKTTLSLQLCFRGEQAMAADPVPPGMPFRRQYNVDMKSQHPDPELSVSFGGSDSHSQSHVPMQFTHAWIEKRRGGSVGGSPIPIRNAGLQPRTVKPLSLLSAPDFRREEMPGTLPGSTLQLQRASRITSTHPSLMRYAFTSLKIVPCALLLSGV